MMRHAVFLILSFAAWVVQAAPPTAVDLVDLSGRQRMLSQRIVKAYAQIGTKTQSDRSQQLLAASVEQFSRQLDLLRSFVAKPEQKAVLAEIERLWPAVRTAAATAVARESAPALNDRANELQTLSHRLAGLIADDADIPAGRLVNLAGRQRMLSQRLAKAYMLRAWNVDSPRIGQELELSRLEFSAALQLLAQAPENTPEIRRELDSVQLQWGWFQAALELEGAVSYRLVVAESSETLLASLERLVAAYARLGQ